MDVVTNIKIMFKNIWFVSFINFVIKNGLFCKLVIEVVLCGLFINIDIFERTFMICIVNEGIG